MMKNKFFAMMAFVLLAGQGAWAQDDMYFTPKKKAKTQSQGVITSEVVDVDAPSRYRISADASDEDDAYYGGSDRDVDEYNRRGTYGAQRQSQYEEIGVADSVTISRDEYDDYVNSRNMQRFDGYSGLSVVVNDPWYYDSWYGPYYNSWRWGTSWYYPWYTSYSWYDPWYSSWYDPWYRSSYWGWHYGSYYGGWRSHYTWHTPYYGYRYRGGYVNTCGGIVNGHRASSRGGSYYGGHHSDNRSGSASRGVRGSRSGSRATSTTVRGNSFDGRSGNVTRGTSGSTSGSTGTRQQGITPRSSIFGNSGYSSSSSSNTTTRSSSSTTRSSSGNSGFSNSGSSRSSSFGNSSGSFGGGTRSGGGGFSSGGGSRGGGGFSGGGGSRGRR